MANLNHKCDECRADEGRFEMNCLCNDCLEEKESQQWHAGYETARKQFEETPKEEPKGE